MEKSRQWGIPRLVSLRRDKSDNEHASEDAKTNSFIVGTKNLKLEAIKDHESSKCHIQVKKRAQGKAAAENAAAMKAPTSLKTAQLDKMKFLFRNSHAIAKKDYEWQCKLDEKKGISTGSTYVNRKQARVFIKHIAAAERKTIQSKIAAAKFLSIMSDGSTDTALMEQEMLYTRLCNRGKVEVHFVGIQDVEKADGENIAQAIDDMMREVSGEERRDGASVMTGTRKGVVSRLRGSNMHVLGIHCMAHRLELAFKDAIKSCSMAKQIEDVLSGLHTFYCKSALNRANIKHSFKILGQNPLVPTRVGGTRWVCHLFRATDYFLRGYQGLTQHLDQILYKDSVPRC
ncbi:zinc finger protein 862-like [Perca flavescens]|uniref:zinc finger protein 862-like n=1 Tax=Perca flavescens TaxID=8167 RepID=UPI00106E71AD|nr:zinc finger protein 862-like [Perca flavescens]